MHNIKIGDNLNDRGSTFYVFTHKKERYAIACDVLFLTIMADDEKRKYILQEDRYGFDITKALAMVQRAQKKGRMQEVLDRSNHYDGSQEDGTTFMATSKVVDVRESSVQMEIEAVTKMGIKSWQGFAEEDVKKRFTMENEKKGDKSVDA